MSDFSNVPSVQRALACFAINTLIACSGTCLAQPADPHAGAFNNQQPATPQAPAQPKPGVPVAQSKSGTPTVQKMPAIPSPAAPSASSVRPAVVINKPVVNVGTKTTNTTTNNYNGGMPQQTQQQPVQLGDPNHPVPGQPVAQIQAKPPTAGVKPSPGAPSPSAPSVSSGPRTVTINNPTVNVGTKTTNKVVNNYNPASAPAAAPAAPAPAPVVATAPMPMAPPPPRSNFTIGIGGIMVPGVVSAGFNQPNYAQPVGQPNAVVYQPTPGVLIGPALVEPLPTATVVNNTEVVTYQPATYQVGNGVQPAQFTQQVQVAQPVVQIGQPVEVQTGQVQVGQPNVTYVDVQPRVVQPTYYATNANAGGMGWDDTPEYIAVWVLSAEPTKRADAAARFLGRVPAGGWKARFEGARTTESGQELLFRGLRQDSQGQFVQIVVRANSAPSKLFQRQQCMITGRLSQICVDDPSETAGILILDDASVK